ncbi:diguanylate cyclase domain-containing protein [Bacillus sp. AK128]
MYEVAYFFFQNMAIIIAFMFLYIKSKDFLLEKKNIEPVSWFPPMFAGIFSLIVMYHPLDYEGMRIDLREVPLFFISYIGGWKWGVISSILPSAYRFSLGGPTVVQGIIQAILLPIVIGAIFHKKGKDRPQGQLINLKKMFGVFILFEVIKSFWMVLTTPVTISLVVIMAVFSTIALLGMSLMLNDDYKNRMMRKKLLHLSNHDFLTQLPNIRWFKEEAQKQINQHKSSSIAMFDVDYFKIFNDSNGHQAGDQVLRNIGQLLTDHIGKNGVIARYGGEEFIVCYPDARNRQFIEESLDQFRRTVEEFSFKGMENMPEGKVTISVGISFSRFGQSLDEIINEADQALYYSKNNGRNKVTTYTAPPVKSIQKA